MASSGSSNHPDRSGGSGAAGAASSTFEDLRPGYTCFQCKCIVPGGIDGFKKHLVSDDHISPFRCGHCTASYSNRRTLYAHLRDHHALDPELSSTLPSDALLPLSSIRTLQEECVSPDNIIHEPVFEEPRVNEPMDTEISHEEVEADSSLVSAAERSVLQLRSLTYMTTVALQAVQEQCHGLMQDTANYLKQRVLDYIALPDKDKNLDLLIQEFSINNPFENLKTKQQQLTCWEKKYGLIPPTEVYLGEAFDSRQHPKRPRLLPTQIHRSYQYVSIIDILKGVMNDPHLRRLILSETSSSDGYLRSFRDGSLFETLPPDLKGAIRVIIYVDDLEILQALSSKAGAYKVAGIYFGIQNLPAELNSLLNYIFVTALAFAEDAKHEEVWELFLQDMKKLETEGFDIQIDGETCNFKAVLVAQIGDTLAAHEILGLLNPSCNAFCRFCYILRSEMWADGLKLGNLRTPERHDIDVLGCKNIIVRRATGVRGPPLLRGLRFFKSVTSSVPDIFHDMNQGICKMEIKLALREYVCKQKYITEKELNSRVKYFDYGFVDKKNKPSPNFTAKYLNNIDSYNLHQTGAQMWCLTRAFPFLLHDLVPEDDKLFKLICLLNEIMVILFSHAVCEYDLQQLESLIIEHHTLFSQIFPGVPLAKGSMSIQEEEIQSEVERENSFENPDDPVVVNMEGGIEEPLVVNTEGDIEEELEFSEEEFAEEESVPHDEDVEVIVQSEEEEEEEEENNSTGATAKRKKKKKKKPKKPKVVRMINKHHHMLHFPYFMRKFGPLINYWCIRYEAKHYFFKLCATVAHNFKNVLKTLMEILQMKICADKLKPSGKRLTMAKRKRELMYVSEAPHRQQLSEYGLQPSDKIYQVNSVVLTGVDYRPELYVTEKLRTENTLPVFSCIKAVYVSSCEERVYLVVQEMCTVEKNKRLCAYRVTPLRRSPMIVREAHMIPSYRLLSLWSPHNSDDLYLAPRTIS